MHISAFYRFDAPPETVWELLNDPDVIAGCLPGCESLEPTGDDTYRASLTVGVAAISGKYQGTVHIADKQPPTSYRLIVEGRGRTGIVKGEAAVRLAAEGNQTVVAVDGTGQVAGTIARVGQRLLGGVAKMMMDKFFGCLATKASSTSQDQANNAS